jgi:prevent-host-death family protein
MKTATVRDLRNHYSQLLSWIGAGEEIVITRKGKAVARLIPEPSEGGGKVDWSRSPALMRDRSSSRVMDAEESLRIRHEASGQW